QLGSHMHQDIVQAVAFSPRGRTLVTGHLGGGVTVLDPRSGTLRTYTQGHIEGVTCVAFSPDGQVLLSGSLDRTARRWKASVPPPVARAVYQDWTSQAWFALYSHDGKRLVSGGDAGNLYLRRFDLEPRLPVLQERTGGLYSIAITRDGKTMATGG